MLNVTLVHFAKLLPRYFATPLTSYGGQAPSSIFSADAVASAVHVKIWGIGRWWWIWSTTIKMMWLLWNFNHSSSIVALMVWYRESA